MSYLTAEHKATLLQLLTDNGLSETEPYAAANRLNEPTTVTVTSLKPFGIADVMAILSAESEDAVMDHHLADEVLTAIRNQDRAAVQLYATRFASRNPPLIATAERDAVLALTTATVNTQATGPSKFAAALPGFYFVHEGVGYAERCHAALIEEARS